MYFMIVLAKVQFNHVTNNRKPVLPIEFELHGNDELVDEDGVPEYCVKILKTKKSLFAKADKNIKDAQKRYKRDYDKKYAHKKV